MKKFLSLVLALVMTMSLVTISAGAKDFSDADAINYDEAVEVLTAIGVVDGYTDGSFKPGTALNRGQAAKIICNLILGPTTAADLSADTQLFSDVAVDHVFAGYISFCVEEGIISGYADGSFKPAAPLTHYAFLKMLLGALGYDAETEGYVGANWSINVAKRALNLGLNKGLDGDFNGVDTVVREEACLYALNTLKATMVEYDAKTTVVVGDATVALSGNIKEISNTGKTEGNIIADRKMQFAEKYFTKLTLDTDSGIYGRPTNEWKNNKKEIGSYASIEPAYIYTEGTKNKEVYKDLGAEIVGDYYWDAYINGAEADVVLPVKNDKNEWAYTGEGTVTEIYIDDEGVNAQGEVTGTVTVVEYNYYIGQVTKVKSDDDGEYITVDELSDGSDLKVKTFYVEGYEEDDYVVYTQDVNEEGKNCIGEVIAPETVTVEVTRVQNNEDDNTTYLRADGEKYTYTEYETDAQRHIVYDLDNLTSTKKVHPTLNKDYILYMDPNGYVLAFELAEEKETKYLYVKDSDEEMGEWSAKVLLADGTTEIVEINEKDTTINWIDNNKYNEKEVSNIDGMVCEYSVNDKGEYKLKIADFETLTNAVIKHGKAYISGDQADNVIVDKKTVFVDDENETAYIGYKEVPNIDEATVYYVVDEKVVEVAFVLGADIYDTDSTYFILTSQDRESLKYDDEFYWDYEDVYVNGEKQNLIVSYDWDADNAGNDPLLKVNTLYKVVKTIDEDYVVEAVEILGTDCEAADTVTAVGEDAFWLSNVDDKPVQFDTDEDTIFVYVEEEEVEPNKYEYSVTEGNLKDMKEEGALVWVVKADENHAELVYIFVTVALETADTDTTVSGQ